jgi:hypothetical protein
MLGQMGSRTALARWQAALEMQLAEEDAKVRGVIAVDVFGRLFDDFQLFDVVPKFGW